MGGFESYVNTLGRLYVRAILRTVRFIPETVPETATGAPETAKMGNIYTRVLVLQPRSLKETTGEQSAHHGTPRKPSFGQRAAAPRPHH